MDLVIVVQVNLSRNLALLSECRDLHGSWHVYTPPMHEGHLSVLRKVCARGSKRSGQMREKMCNTNSRDGQL